MRKTVLVVVSATLLASTVGCGGDPAPAPAASAAPVTQQGAEPSAAPTGVEEPLTAAAIVERLQAADLGLTDGVAQTEDDDPNDLLGRPGGYTSRASADLPGGDEEGGKFSVDRGLVVEVFDEASLAQRRSDYIKGLQEASPILGTEWHYRTGDGTGLVRVSGKVKPSLAKKLETAVAGLSVAGPAPVTAASSGADGLKSAVQAYSDAFLTGDAKTAYDLLSERCRKRRSLTEFTAIVDAAKQMYGSALPFESYAEKVSGDLARVTYTYSVKAINQDAEPWSREGGDWHQDDC